MDVCTFRAESFSLLLGVVTGPDQWSAFTDLEAPGKGAVLHAHKLIRMNPTVYGEVIASRLKVLTDGDDVRIALGSDIVHEFVDL